jgi:hypothetical protein
MLIYLLIAFTVCSMSLIVCNTAVGIRHADHRGTLYPQKLALTSTTSGGRSVGIVRSRTQATEFNLLYIHVCCVLLERCVLIRWCRLIVSCVLL